MLDSGKGRVKSLLAEKMGEVARAVLQIPPPVTEAEHARLVGRLPREQGRTTGGAGGCRAVAVPEEGGPLSEGPHLRGRQVEAVQGIIPSHIVSVEDDHILHVRMNIYE